MKRKFLATFLAFTLIFSNLTFTGATEHTDVLPPQEEAEECDYGDTENEVLPISTVSGSSTELLNGPAEEFNKPPLTYRGEDEIRVSSIEETMPNVERGAGEALPSSYKTPYITAAKSQGSYGTCWAFAFISASESNILRKGLGDADTLDLSELQLAYFTYNTVIDPLGGTSGDSFKLKEAYSLDNGGNQQVTTRRVATWQGLTDESCAPYERGESLFPLDNSLAYSADSYHLENSHWISMKDINLVKENIMKIGACASSYESNKMYEGLDDNNYANVYKPSTTNTNHAITIVGWDDNYSKDNFGNGKAGENYQPAKNGAWLCKNSWGDDWSIDGYFWISYEDAALSNNTAHFYDYGKADNYDFNYQYDGGAIHSGSGYGLGNDVYGANIYTATSNQTLKAISYFTSNISYESDIYIYADCESDNPTSGELVTSQSVSQLYSGFHTVTLNEPVYLRQGTRFSIVLKHRGEPDESKYLAIDSQGEFDWAISTTASQRGQSFLSYNGKNWKDISTENRNCRIKGYSDIDTAIKVTGITLNNSEATVSVGNTYTLSPASILPANAADKSVSWTSSDSSVASVSSVGVVTAHSPGVATITCKAVDGSRIKANCNITVTQPVTSITLNTSSAQLCPTKSMSLTADVQPANAYNKAVSWTSSNSSVASVSSSGVVTGISSGTAVITCRAMDGSGIKANCNITVTQPVTGITLNASSAQLCPTKSMSLTANVQPANAYNKAVSWTSSDSSVASVSSSGVVTGISSGTAVITCRAMDGSGRYAVCNVTVSVKKGDTLYDSKTKASYKITGTGSKNKTVTYSVAPTTVKSVKVPNTVVIDNVTYKVTAIGNSAFKNNKKMTKVTIGNNVTSIGAYAFSGCSKLASVSIGEKVTSIGDKAFYKCTILKKITIPAMVTKIGKSAFYGCKNLKSITIKTQKLTSKKVGNQAFKGIHKQATIKVPKKKLSSYKKILKAKGVGSKVKIKK